MDLAGQSAQLGSVGVDLEFLTVSELLILSPLADR
jgi:hypothetical protein